MNYSDILKFFDFEKPWERHCFLVARIALRIGRAIPWVDSNFLFYYALVHDIGRITEKGKSFPKSHPVEGYKFLTEGENKGKGYERLAMSCITHTFPDLKEIVLVPGICHDDWDKPKRQYDEIDSYISGLLTGYQPTIYDAIVTIADLMAGTNQIVTIQERLNRTYEKYGDKPNRPKVEQAIVCLTEKVEKEIPGNLTIEEVVGIQKNKHNK